MKGHRIQNVIIGIFLLVAAPVLAQNEGPRFSSVPIHEAFVSNASQASSPVISSRAPPLPLHESSPTSPSPDLVWISGYWAYVPEINDFSWVCGVWRRPPPERSWIYGKWVNVQGKWVRTSGFWSHIEENKLNFLQTPPPEDLDEVAPELPGNDYFWIHGYWVFSAEKGEYVWLKGKFEPFNEKWILTPAYYIWTPNGYIFNDLYWDYDLDLRGVAYACSYANSGPVEIIPSQTIIQELFIYYPDYIPLYSYWWHFHPNYWEHCNCLPPWWNEGSFWTYPRHRLWNLWWWWSHPKSAAPNWLSADDRKRFAPNERVENLMKEIPKPTLTYPPLPKNQRSGGTGRGSTLPKTKQPASIIYPAQNTTVKQEPANPNKPIGPGEEKRIPPVKTNVAPTPPHATTTATNVINDKIPPEKVRAKVPTAEEQFIPSGNGGDNFKSHQKYEKIKSPDRS